MIVADGQYLACATGNPVSLQVMTSADLKSWTGLTDPLANLPTWASFGQTWAPDVMQVSQELVMYYTVHDTALNETRP